MSCPRKPQIGVETRHRVDGKESDTHLTVQIHRLKVHVHRRYASGTVHVLTCVSYTYTSGGFNAASTRWHFRDKTSLSVWLASRTVTFSDFLHGDVEHTDSLCLSLERSAVCVMVVMVCVSSQKPSLYIQKLWAVLVLRNSLDLFETQC